MDISLGITIVIYSFYQFKKDFEDVKPSLYKVQMTKFLHKLS